MRSISRLRHAQDRAVHVDVFAAGQLGVEAGADLQQAGDPAADDGPAGGRFGDAAEDLQQRALARPVAADDADDLALVDLERDVLEGPEDIVRVVAVTGRCRAGGAGCKFSAGRTRRPVRRAERGCRESPP